MSTSRTLPHDKSFRQSQEIIDHRTRYGCGKGKGCLNGIDWADACRQRDRQQHDRRDPPKIENSRRKCLNLQNHKCLAKFCIFLNEIVCWAWLLVVVAAAPKLEETWKVVSGISATNQPSSQLQLTLRMLEMNKTSRWWWCNAPGAWPYHMAWHSVHMGEPWKYRQCPSCVVGQRNIKVCFQTGVFLRIAIFTCNQG